MWFQTVLFCSAIDLWNHSPLFIRSWNPGFISIVKVCQLTIFWARTANSLLNYNTVFIFSNTEPVTSALPQTAVYEITRVTKADEGSYSCLARNAAGTMEERLHLTVEENEVNGGQFPNRGDIIGVYIERFCLCSVSLALQCENIDCSVLIWLNFFSKQVMH